MRISRYGIGGRRPVAAALMLFLALATAAPARADGTPGGLLARVRTLLGGTATQSGAYLAGRFAMAHNDFGDAADFLSQALAHDPGNLTLQRRTFTLMISSGRMNEAVPLAQRILHGDRGDQLALTLLMLDDVRAGRYGAAAERLGRLEHAGIARFVLPLMEAWVRAGQGDKEAALASLDRLAGETGFQPIALFHKALILDLIGDRDEARAAYQAVLEVGQTLRLIEAAASFYTRTGEPERAAALFDRFRAENPGNPMVEAARERLARNAAPPVATAAEGLAEALFQVASILGQDGGSDFALLYTRLTLFLRPGFALGQLLLGDVLDAREQHEAALAAFRAVDPAVPDAWLARLRMAAVLDQLDRRDEALALLAAMAEERPESTDALIMTGDLRRAQERYGDAVAAYDAAFARAPQQLGESWAFLYKRGIALERKGEWERAQADLQHAIALNPDHAQLLNYLGYSWIDRGQNLAEAEAMIRRAVELQPQDGYIVDSLGWAYYRTGRLGEAVTTLERAVSLKPDDPVINDHLGDAYWQAGRRDEARFQWQRARREATEPDLVMSIEQKLANGMPASAAAAGTVGATEAAHPVVTRQ